MRDLILQFSKNIFNSLEMKAHIKTATTVVKKGVEQTEYVDLGVGG